MMSSGLDVKPQYVHHMSPEPPPEVSYVIPNQKDQRRRWLKFTEATIYSVLLLLLVAGVLLGYYYSSPCAHGLRCSDGSCVWKDQWCDGVPNCRSGQDEANCVRLQGADFLLQVYWGHRWTNVCSSDWTEQSGRASCQLMGFSSGTYSQSGQQAAPSDQSILVISSNFNPEVSFLKQLQLRSSCPGNNAVTLRCTDCGRSPNSSGPGGSQLASEGAWPWQVSLRFAGTHRCGGAIISPYWTLTAAHCVASLSNPADWAVYAGIVRPLGTLFNPAYPVSRIIIHEGFNGQTRRNDIALVKLSRPLDLTDGHIGAICLTNAGLNVTTHQQGWMTTFSPPSGAASGAPYLSETRVSLVDAAECNKSTAYSGAVLADMFCARAATSVCHTDSGGPLVTLQDGVWWLLGDSVMGGHCTVQDNLGVYGNVSYFRDWIQQQMMKHRDA
ncbi:transmembrane protease serine 2-like [Nelusetta ayraudi]|uniref:transmembrane protease serine 2-like n=1 Tax=Nelusetta ayraudi TaxID=303726 RepID=UPI003F6ECFE0